MRFSVCIYHYTNEFADEQVFFFMIGSESVFLKRYFLIYRPLFSNSGNTSVAGQLLSSQCGDQEQKVALFDSFCDCFSTPSLFRLNVWAFLHDLITHSFAPLFGFSWYKWPQKSLHFRSSFATMSMNRVIIFIVPKKLISGGPLFLDFGNDAYEKKIPYFAADWRLALH